MIMIEEDFTHGRHRCIVAFTVHGHRTGYVSVKKDHPAFGKDYDELDVGVHGGLTFSRHGEDGYPIDGEDWWFGFDCAHFGDGKDLVTAFRYFPQAKQELLTMKLIEARFDTSAHETVRSKEYVRAECIRLAEQLSVVAMRGYSE